MKTYIIIYLDLVAYSKNNENIQITLFKSFQKQLHHILYEDIIDDKCILIPTGDGMIVALEDDMVDNYIKSIDLVIEIIDWAKKQKANLRSAIHVGEVNILIDINKNKNIVGNVINDASRMLSGADDDAIIISEYFYGKYLRTADTAIGVKFDINENYSYLLVDDDDIIDKHGYKHSVYNTLIYKNNKEYGFAGKILNKYFTNIYSKDYPKKQNLKNNFFKKIKYCESLILFGIYHPSTPHILKNIEINQFRQVEINIFFASDDLKDTIKDFFNSDKDNLDFKNKEKSKIEILEWYKNHEYSQNIRLKIFEYNSFYPFGFSMVDNGIKGKGFIHMSNYIPSIAPEDIPYIEVEWKTNTMPSIYKFYNDYIKDKILLNKDIEEIKT